MHLISYSYKIGGKKNHYQCELTALWLKNKQKKTTNQLILSGLFSEVKVFVIGHKSSSKLDPAFSNSDCSDITDFVRIHECVYMYVYREKLQVRYRHLVKDASGTHIWERARSRRWRAAAVWNKNCKFIGAYCSFLWSPFSLGIQEFKTQHPHFWWCLPLLILGLCGICESGFNLDQDLCCWRECPNYLPCFCFRAGQLVWSQVNWTRSFAQRAPLMSPDH